MASLESDILDIFKVKITFPIGQTVLFFKFNSKLISDFDENCILVLDSVMCELFLNIHRLLVIKRICYLYFVRLKVLN